MSPVSVIPTSGGFISSSSRCIHTYVCEERAHFVYMLFCLISGVLFQSMRKSSGVYGRIHLFNSACLAFYETSH